MEHGSDEYYMKMALAEAEKAAARNEVPVGAVVVAGGTVIARAHNLTETLNDPTAHAEMQAITAATSYLGGKYLNKSQYVRAEHGAADISDTTDDCCDKRPPTDSDSHVRVDDWVCQAIEDSACACHGRAYGKGKGYCSVYIYAH